MSSTTPPIFARIVFIAKIVDFLLDIESDGGRALIQVVRITHINHAFRDALLHYSEDALRREYSQLPAFENVRVASVAGPSARWYSLSRFQPQPVLSEYKRVSSLKQAICRFARQLTRFRSDVPFPQWLLLLLLGGEKPITCSVDHAVFIGDDATEPKRLVERATAAQDIDSVVTLVRDLRAAADSSDSERKVGLLLLACTHKSVAVLEKLLRLHDDGAIQINFDRANEDAVLHVAIAVRERDERAKLVRLLVGRKEIDVNKVNSPPQQQQRPAILDGFVINSNSSVLPPSCPLHAAAIKARASCGDVSNFLPIIQMLLLRDDCTAEVPGASLLVSQLVEKSKPDLRNATHSQQTQQSSVPYLLQYTIHVLHFCAQHNDVELVKLILAHRKDLIERPVRELEHDLAQGGINVTAKNKIDITALMIAVETGASFPIVEALLNAGARPDYRMSLSDRPHLRTALLSAYHNAGDNKNSSLQDRQPVLAVALALSLASRGGGPFRELLRERWCGSPALINLLTLKYDA